MHICRRIWLAAYLTIACGGAASAETVTLFHVFLRDGSTVVSYGEYARVGDRLVFSMPLGAVDANGSTSPDLHVVSLPASAVDWAATTRYADSARASHYLANRAADDYAVVAGQVASTLNAIYLTKDSQARLNIALEARWRLVTWPRDHYGYRAQDVAEMIGLLDEAISELRAASGATAFSLDFVANTPTAAPHIEVPMRRVPTAAEALSQAVAVARVTDDAAERVSILRGVLAAIDKSKGQLPRSWAGPTRTWALRTIREEARIQKQYSTLTANLLSRAETAAARGDVRTVERVLDTAKRSDEQLGRKRPEEIKSLLDQVRVHLDAAQRLRLSRDQWQERMGSYRAYARIVRPIIEGLVRAQGDLDDIKRLAGSEAGVLVALADRLSMNTKTLAVVSVPDDLKPGHALLTSAVNLAETAVRTRRQATVSGELSLAWDASSAAAGSMLLLTRAQESMEAATRYPQIR